MLSTYRQARPAVLLLIAIAGGSLGLAGSCASGPDERVETLKKADFNYRLAGGHFSAGEMMKALAELVTALELDPEHAHAHHLMAIVRIARREFYEALKHAKKAVELKPELHIAKNNLGAIYLALCRWEDAVKLYEQLIREPRYATPYIAHVNLGWALWKLDRREEAIRQYKKAVFFNPKFCIAFNNLGLAYLEEGRHSDAEKQLKKALSVDAACKKTYAEPHLHLARLAERQSNPSEACIELAACVAKAPPGEEQTPSGCGHSPVGKRCERKAEQLGCGPDQPPPSSGSSG